MPTSIIPGQTRWSLKVDNEGYRTYSISFKVRGAKTDGPFNVLQTPGLPVVGSAWAFDGDYDPDVWCRSETTVDPFLEGEPNTQWKVTCTFSNKPVPQNQQRCNDTPTGDPLLEPQKISGQSVRYTEEATTDRFGNPIVTSALEPIRGAQVEFDRNRAQVTVEQNVADLQLALCTAMVDRLNAYPLWGLTTRRIKLSEFHWERKFYGTCYVYYTRRFTFDVRFDGFDPVLLDEGTMVLRGRWDKDPASLTFGTYVLAPGVSPSAIFQGDLIRYKDWNGENATVILDGQGRPYDATGSSTGTGDDNPGQILVEKYDEADFLLLGIPIVF